MLATSDTYNMATDVTTTMQSSVVDDNVKEQVVTESDDGSDQGSTGTSEWLREIRELCEVSMDAEVGYANCIIKACFSFFLSPPCCCGRVKHIL